MSFSLSPYLAKTCLSVPSSLLYCDLPCVLCFNASLSCFFTYTITLHFTNKHAPKWIEEIVPENWPRHLLISLERTLKSLSYFSLETFGTPAIKMVDGKLSSNFTGASATPGKAVRGVSQKVSLIPKLKSCLNQKPQSSQNKRKAPQIFKHNFTSFLQGIERFTITVGHAIQQFLLGEGGRRSPMLVNFCEEIPSKFHGCYLFFLLFQFLGNLSMTCW